MGRLSTHVLDLSLGKPAAGVRIELMRLDSSGASQNIVSTLTNADGRTDRPLLEGENFKTGVYELRFAIGDYFAGKAHKPAFLDVIPLRFTVVEPDGHYHVPLLCTPWSYSTYRGS